MEFKEHLGMITVKSGSSYYSISFHSFDSIVLLPCGSSGFSEVTESERKLRTTTTNKNKTTVFVMNCTSVSVLLSHQYQRLYVNELWQDAQMTFTDKTLVKVEIKKCMN